MRTPRSKRHDRARRAARAAAAPLATLVLLLSGCGEGGTIPASSARDLEAKLDAVDKQFDKGDCTTLTGTGLPELSASVAALPGKVDEGVRASLGRAVERLSQLAADCEEPVETETEATETATIPTETEPTTEVETTETEEPETRTREEPPTEETEPEEDGDFGPPPPEDGGPPPADDAGGGGGRQQPPGLVKNR